MYTPYSVYVVFACCCLCRFSKGKRSKIRGSTVKPLDLIAEDEGIPQASTSGQVLKQPKRSTRRNKQTQPEASLEAEAVRDCSAEQVPEEESQVVDMELEMTVPDTEIETGEPQPCSSITTLSPPDIPAPKVSVKISSTDRRSAELVAQHVVSPGCNATKTVMAGTPSRARRSYNAGVSLKLRYSKAGLRHSMTQDPVRRTCRRPKLKKKKSTCGDNTTCSSNASGESCWQIVDG